MSRLPLEHREEAARLTALLHSEGRASHVTVERLLQGWEHLAPETSTYRLTIDDYTNDVTSRDALQVVLAAASEPLADYLTRRIEAADERFRAATVDDDGAAVNRYFRTDKRDGWWWRRRPDRGPLSEYLDRA